MIFMKDINFL